MNKLNLVLALTILLISCSKKKEIPPFQPGERILYFEHLAANFQNPPVEYRTVPFWVWNKDVSKTDIDRTLVEYKDKGIY